MRGGPSRLDLVAVAERIAVRVRVGGIGAGLQDFGAIGEAVTVRVFHGRVGADQDLFCVTQAVTIGVRGLRIRTDNSLEVICQAIPIGVHTVGPGRAIAGHKSKSEKTETHQSRSSTALEILLSWPEPM